MAAVSLAGDLRLAGLLVAVRRRRGSEARTSGRQWCRENNVFVFIRAYMQTTQWATVALASRTKLHGTVCAAREDAGGRLHQWLRESGCV